MPAPTKDLAPLAAATEGPPTPYAMVDLDAFDANTADMVERAHGLPIRIASKSLRCRTLMDRALAGPPPASSTDASFLAGAAPLGPASAVSSPTRWPRHCGWRGTGIRTCWSATPPSTSAR